MPQETKIPVSGRKLPQNSPFALIALGSNTSLGESDPREVLLSAVERVSKTCGLIRGQSDIFATPAYPAGSGPDFANAALVIETELDAGPLLRACHSVEMAHGRNRRQRWGPRTLDVDLLALGNLIYPDPENYALWRDLPLEKQMQNAPDDLVLPHPRLQDRAFVLVPLLQALEQAGVSWHHPVSRLSVADMLRILPAEDIDTITPWPSNATVLPTPPPE